jgi:hypothetical protein
MLNSQYSFHGEWRLVRIANVISLLPRNFLSLCSEHINRMERENMIFNFIQLILTPPEIVTLFFFWFIANTHILRIVLHSLANLLPNNVFLPEVSSN